jgi:hypothetical protein
MTVHSQAYTLTFLFLKPLGIGFLFLCNKNIYPFAGVSNGFEIQGPGSKKLGTWPPSPFLMGFQV